MDNVEALLLMASVAVLALAAFAAYRWRQRARVRRIERWVRQYLVARYGAVPAELHINCSDDALWPVLVSFDGQQARTRHYLRFSCAGPVATFALVAEREERATSPADVLPPAAAG